MPDKNPPLVPIAVIGVAALMPGSEDATKFWANIVSGKDLITDVPPSHWLIQDFYNPDPAAPDQTYCKRGAFLPEIDFDPMEFGIPPNNLPATDPSQLLALYVAKKLLEDASQGDPSRLSRNRLSVVLGVTAALESTFALIGRLHRPVWAKAMRESGLPESQISDICERISKHYVPWQEASFPGLLNNVVSGRIANRFDFHGTNLTTDAACASSLSALQVAINELQLGQSDLAIAGGVDTLNDVFAYLCFSKTPALSFSGDCRPFSDAADGTLLGEGLAMFALKRLADAERDRDQIYAVIRGIGSSSDGRHKSIYAPRPEGQALALRRTYEAAGYGADTVELLEAHGTGTKAGDVAEVEALKAVFSSGAFGRRWCALGSVKSQIGHTKGAAGAAGLFKAIMALHHKVLPPTIKVQRPNPALELASSPFYLNTQARPWIRDSAHPRRASVSSFGFGGTNFHVALEEYVPTRNTSRPRRLRSSPTELVLLSAASPAELAARISELLAKPQELAALAQHSQLHFVADGKVRLAVVAQSTSELANKLSPIIAALASGQSTVSGPGVYLCADAPKTDGVAFLFPGQGSQYIGMGADLAMALDAARRVWDTAPRWDGIGAHELVFPIPVWSDEARAAQEAKLTATEWAQPALGIASLATLEILRAVGVQAQYMAGHSFGELSALCAANVLSPAELLPLSRRRGELVRDAAQKSPGAMLSIRRSAEAVQALLDEHGLTAVIANHNGPSEVVVSGATEAIAALEKVLAGTDAQSRRLPVSAAFHSPAVAAAVPELLSYLEHIPVAAPAAHVYGNADATVYPSDPAAVRRTLAEQLARPVRFFQMIEALYAQGVRTFVEVGPGSVLTDLVGRILGSRPHLAVETDRRGRHGLTSLQLALGRLAVQGIPINWAPLWEGAVRAEAARPKAKAAGTVKLNGTNYGKLYPPPQGVSSPALSAGTSKPEAPAAPLPSPTPPAVSRADTQGFRHAWLEAYQEAERRTAETHATFQRSLADAHAAYLKAAEASFLALRSLGSASELPPAAPQGSWPPAAMPLPPSMPPMSPMPPSPPPAPASPAGQDTFELGAHPPARVAAAVPPPEPAAGPTLAPPASGSLAPSLGSEQDLRALLMRTISEKTGYQESLLGMEMDLEADLGIDSIKRVEILAALRDQMPQLPEVKPSEVASLRTLGAVGEFLRSRLGQDTAAKQPKAAGTSEPAAAPAVAASAQAPSRYSVRMIEEPAIDLAMAGLHGSGRTVITEDGAGVAAALATELLHRGIHAEVLSEVPPDAQTVVFLGGLRPIDSVAAALSVNREAFRAARALAPRAKANPSVFVTVQDTGGDFGLSGREPLRAWLGGLSALAATLQREWPDAAVKAIDCARGGRSPQAIAQAIATELCHGGRTLHVGLSADCTRAVRQLVPNPLPPASPLAIDARSVILASGGGRGVTAAALIELARARRPRIALIGRTPLLAQEPEIYRTAASEIELRRAILGEAEAAGQKLSPAQASARAAAVLASREIRATLDALHAAGSEALYYAVDVRDQAALEQTLSEVRTRFGAITALMHGAGVLADKRIEDKTDDQFDRVFDTKVAGLLALFEATAADPLTFICLFSSIVAHTGNAGQADYAMANEVLNQVAAAERARRGPRCLVRSIGWGPLEGGMVTPELARHFARAGVPLIPLAEGARALLAEAAVDATEPVVVLGHLPAAEPLSAVALEVQVDARSHAYLRDHSIASVPVVPFVLAIEWFLRAARAYHPNKVVTALRKLRVQRGIKLPHFDRGERLLIRYQAQPASPGSAPGVTGKLELLGAGNVPYYSALCDLADARPEAPLAPALPADLKPLPGYQIYDGYALFHGPKFQVLKELIGYSQAGAAATLVGLSACGWPSERWQSDAAAMDGAAQLSGLCMKLLLGSAALPMAIEQVTVYRDGPLPGLLRAAAYVRSLSASKLVCDVILSDAEGRVLIEGRGIENIVRPAPAADAAASPAQDPNPPEPTRT